MAPHAALAEIGTEYELALVERDSVTDAYLRLNPSGRVPTLEDDGLVLTESAAILLHLADRFPSARLLPEHPSADRSLCYRALMHLTNTVQPALMRMYYPERFGTSGVLEAAVVELHMEFVRLDAAVGRQKWLVGTERTAADLFLFMLTDWGRDAPLSTGDLPGLRAHYERCLELPGVQRMMAEQELDVPVFD